MSSRNDITGDDLVSKAATSNYLEGWDRIFGAKKARGQNMPTTCPHCKSEDAVLHGTCMFCNKSSEVKP